jgi:hypothetical protein
MRYQPRTGKKDYEPIINPVDGEKVHGDTSRYIRKVRRVRNNARRGMRSGNPAKAAEAARVYAEAPELIRAAYRQDLNKRARS